MMRTRMSIGAALAAFVAGLLAAPPVSGRAEAEPPVRSTSVGLAPALSDWEVVPVEEAVSPVRARDVRAGPMSADGRYLAVTWEARWSQISVYDHETGTAEPVSVTPVGARARGGDSYPVAMTPDGRYLLFSSEARDLVRRDTNRQQDVFLRDLRADRTRRISVGWEGQQDDSEFGSYPVGISDNGRAAFFTSWGTRLAPGFTTPRARVYVRYLDKPTTVMVSRNGRGEPAPGSVGVDVSHDGRFLLFDSSADNLPHPPGGDNHVYRRNLWSGRTVLVSQRNNGSGFRLQVGGVSLSGNGRAASFRASFVDRTTNISVPYVRDIGEGVTYPGVTDADGVRRGGSSYLPFRGGNTWLIYSGADLTGEEGAGARHDRDTYLRLPGGQLVRLSGIERPGLPRRLHLFGSVSRDRSVVVFSTPETLVDADVDAEWDVYLRHLAW